VNTIFKPALAGLAVAIAAASAASPSRASTGTAWTTSDDVAPALHAPVIHATPLSDGGAVVIRHIDGDPEWRWSQRLFADGSASHAVGARSEWLFGAGDGVATLHTRWGADWQCSATRSYLGLDRIDSSWADSGQRPRDALAGNGVFTGWQSGPISHFGWLDAACEPHVLYSGSGSGGDGRALQIAAAGDGTHAHALLQTSGGANLVRADRERVLWSRSESRQAQLRTTVDGDALIVRGNALTRYDDAGNVRWSRSWYQPGPLPKVGRPRKQGSGGETAL
jgi:hypothetical protein